MFHLYCKIDKKQLKEFKPGGDTVRFGSSMVTGLDGDYSKYSFGGGEHRITSKVDEQHCRKDHYGSGDKQKEERIQEA